MDQLYMKNAILDNVTMNNTASFRPFDIGLGVDEYLELHMLVVYIFAIGAVDYLADWGLLQKNLRNVDGAAVGNRPFLRLDNDLLANGIFVYNALTQATATKDIVKFPKPILVPRSPSMEFISTLNAASSMSAMLFYKIKRNKSTVLKLMKQFKGRGQTE